MIISLVTKPTGPGSEKYEMSSACDLKQKHCKPCEGGVAPLDEHRTALLIEQIPGWEANGDSTAIHRRFAFRNFHEVMAFVNALAWVAHTQDHHPDFSAGYNYCEVTYTTHAIDGLSDNDFICAAKINALMD